MLSRIIKDDVFGPEGPKNDIDADAGLDLVHLGSGETEYETYERLVAEASECLRDREVFGAVSGRPVSDIIAYICRQLGVSPDWLSLSEKSWAQEEIRSGQVGDTLAALLPQGRTAASYWPRPRGAPLRPADQFVPARPPPGADPP